MVTRVRTPSLTAALTLAAVLASSALPAPGALAMTSLAVSLLMAVAVGPTNSLGAVGALLPLVFVTVQIGATEWSILELALLSCGAACGVELLRPVAKRSGYATLRRMLHPVDLTVVAGVLLVAGLLSLEWVADSRASGNSLREFRRVIVEPLAVILAVRLSALAEARRLAAHCLAIGGLAVSIIALAQIGLRSSGVLVGDVFRPIGTYPHPNNLALYLERIVWLPMASFSGRLSGRVAVAASGLLAVASAATLSRGAVIALAVGATTWLVLTRRRAPRLVLLSGAAALVALLVVARYGGDSTESLDARSTIWHAAYRMARDYPLTGIGIDQFYQLYGTRYIDPGGWAERYTSHPHNIALDFWLQLGVAGLILLMAITWLTARRAWHVRTSSHELITAALIAGLTGGLAHGLIDNGFFLPDLATFLWITLALSSPPWDAVAPA